MKTEYRIIGRFRKDDKSHVVDWNRNWTKEDAERRLDELKRKSEQGMSSKKRTSTQVGMIGVSTEYYSEYDLLDLKIQSRQVTAWSDTPAEMDHYTYRYEEFLSRRAKRGTGAERWKLLEEYRVVKGALNLAYLHDPDNKIPEYIAELQELDAQLDKICCK